MHIEPRSSGDHNPILQQTLADASQDPLQKVKKIEEEIAEVINHELSLPDKMKKVGFIFASTIAMGVVCVLEGIRSCCGLRDKFRLGPDFIVFKNIWYSKPLSPEAAKKVVEKFNELDRIFKNNKLFIQCSTSKIDQEEEINNRFGKRRVEIYNNLSQFHTAPNTWMSFVDSGEFKVRQIRGYMQELDKLRQAE